MNTQNRYSFCASLCLAIIVNLITIESVAAKDNRFQFKPYAGVEYQYQHIKSNSGWHNGYFMPANFNNYGVFAGVKYHPNFGIELGYYHYINRSQAQNVLSSFEGQTASGETLVIGQMRMKGYSLDWNVHFQLDPRFNIFVLIGAVNYQPDLVILTSEGTNLGNALRTVTGRNETVLRLGFGMEYEEDWWGARARILWDRTQYMKLNVATAQQIFPGITPDAFKQSFVVTVGVFYRFFR